MSFELTPSLCMSVITAAVVGAYTLRVVYHVITGR